MDQMNVKRVGILSAVPYIRNITICFLPELLD